LFEPEEKVLPVPAKKETGKKRVEKLEKVEEIEVVYGGEASREADSKKAQ
jgi:hypothetical protein